MGIEQDIARRHIRALIEEARSADVPLDVIGRAALSQIIEAWKEQRSPEDISSELRFTADNLAEDTDFTFMRP